MNSKDWTGICLPRLASPRIRWIKELTAAHRAGLVQVELVARSPIRDFDTGPCLRFPRQAQFHPLKYLEALARAFEKKGGRIFNKTPADEFNDKTPTQVKTSNGSVVSAGAIVVATNTPVNDWLSIHTKQAAYRTYVIGIRVPQGSIVRAHIGIHRIHIITFGWQA